MRRPVSIFLLALLLATPALAGCKPMGRAIANKVMRDRAREAQQERWSRNQRVGRRPMQRVPTRNLQRFDAARRQRLR